MPDATSKASHFQFDEILFHRTLHNFFATHLLPRPKHQERLRKNLHRLPVSRQLPMACLHGRRCWQSALLAGIRRALLGMPITLKPISGSAPKPLHAETQLELVTASRVGRHFYRRSDKPTCRQKTRITYRAPSSAYSPVAFHYLAGTSFEN
jgi:hypothetical protein